MSLFWSILIAVAWPVIHAFALFVCFLAFLTVYRAHLNGSLAKAALVTRGLCWVIVEIALVVDVALNWTLATIVLWEWPRHYTFTDRCSSHLEESNWRGKLCRWICSQLDLFHEGGHCRTKRAA